MKKKIKSKSKVITPDHRLKYLILILLLSLFSLLLVTYKNSISVNGAALMGITPVETQVKVNQNLTKPTIKKLN